MTDKIIDISPRLECCAKKISAPFLYDVGTDHCFIPVYAIQNLLAERAIASDIADGPLKKAAETVAKYGLEDRIRLIKSDGLDDIEIEFPCDIVIAGMGGELIGRVILDKKELKNPFCRLILQPMTKQDVLREILYGNGFNILSETVVDEGKLYNIIVAKYDSVKRTADETVYLLGDRFVQTDDVSYLLSCERKLEQLEKVSEEKRRGGCSAENEKRIIKKIQTLISEKSINERQTVI